MNAIWRDPGLPIADRWQRNFPICERPYARIADMHGTTEADILGMFEALSASGVVGRIGAVVRPNTAGASTLAALSCPAADADEIATVISAEPFVNHNYERDHAINLWFVVAAPCETALAETLARISRRTGCDVLDLRLERPFHIDLGFGLTGKLPRTQIENAQCRQASGRERALLAVLEEGLPLVPRPFAIVAQRLGWEEARVVAAIGTLLQDGVISRFGCVIRHRELGFTANAMAVWDVPDALVDETGARLAREEGVTLCYRRNRQLPWWRYNLFCMIHGRQRAQVQQQISDIIGRNALAGIAHDVLFSRRCFTQRGARFSPAKAGAAA